MFDLVSCVHVLSGIAAVLKIYEFLGEPLFKKA